MIKKQNKSTPKSEKKKSVEETKTLVFKDGQDEVEPDHVLKVCETIKKSVESEDEKNQLFSEDGQRVNVQITGIKLPKDKRQQLVRATLPHNPLPSIHDVCLFVKDQEKGIRPDHEKNKQEFQELINGKGIDRVTVITLRELKVEYKQFEAKTALCHKFDKFLVDQRITRLIPKFLGKPFYKRKRFPVDVNMKASNLKAEIGRGIRTAVLPLNHHGVCSMAQIGNTNMSSKELTENAVALCKTLQKKYPGGWKNIRSIHIKAEKSMAVPIHISTTSANEVGFVDATIPDRVSRQPVTDELSTRPGMEVTVAPSGQVKISKSADPAWDDEKDEPFVDESDEEENPEAGEKAVEEKNLKRKVKEEKKSKKEKNKPKKAKVVQADEDSDSDSENIEETEDNYYKQRNGREVDEEKQGEEKADEEEEEEEGEEDDDDVEEDEEESECDDENEDSVVENFVDSDEEDSSGDEDEKLMLQK